MITFSSRSGNALVNERLAKCWIDDPANSMNILKKEL